MSTFKTSSIIDVYKMIKAVSRKYFMSFNQIVLNRNIITEDSEEEIEFLTKVEIAYNELNDEGKRFINSEFFFNEPKGWWIGYYSRSQFFKLKKKYSLEFMRHLNIYVF